MGLLDWIERMRQKPEPVRRRATVVLSGVMTTIIVLVWLLVSTISDGSDKKVVLPGDYAEAPEGSVTSILAQFRDGTRVQFNVLESAVAEFKGQFFPQN